MADFILDNLIFFIHCAVILLIYRQITGVPIKWIWFLEFPLCIRILYYIYAPLSYIVEISFLLIIALYKNRYGNRLLDVFYGLFPVVIESLLFRGLLDLFWPYLGIQFVPFYRNFTWELISELLVFPIFYLVMKGLKVDYSNLQQGFEKSANAVFLFVSDTSMIVYTILIESILIFQTVFNHNVEWRKGLVIAYLLLFLIMMGYMNGLFKEQLEEEILEQKDEQIHELANYSAHVEELYNDIRSFRHDYLNVLSSLGYAIEKRDINSVEKIYNSVLSQTGDYFKDSRFDISNLAGIKDDAIKSIVFSKLMAARNQGLNFQVEVEEDFELTKMGLLDFIKILTIFLDNAIEASQAGVNDRITVAFISGPEETLIVENETEGPVGDVSHLFTQGFSTKGTGRGLGLANVVKILDNYPRATLQTKSSDNTFSHTLTMK